MYSRNLFRRSKPSPTDSNKTDSADDVSILELLLVRALCLVCIALVVRIALTAAETGKIEAKSSRIGFAVSGDSLWAGYAVLVALIGVGLLGFFFNYASREVYKKLRVVIFAFLVISILLAKVIGG